MLTRILAPISLLSLAAAALIGAQAAAQDSDAIASQVRALFTDKCIDCHGSEVEKPKAGFKGVELVDELLKNPKYIKRFDPANSLLYQYLSGAQTPQMPKGDDPLSAEQLTLVRAWIGEKPGGGTTTTATEATAVKFVARPIIDEEVVLKLIHADLVALPAADRVNYRYITYANLWNERLPDGTSASELAKFQKETDDLLESTRLGFAKMLNSLSWSPTMAMPKAIDKDRLVYRIDLRGMLCAEHRDHWSGKQWDMLCARFPYGRKIGAQQEDEIVQWLGTELPCVRADWFVFATSRPPLYHDLLGLPGGDGKPGADYALERLLGIDVRKNILEGVRIARAGIHDKKSGVSQHNRLIERHERAAGAYYWKSYDFGDSVGTGNLVLHPLGPANLEGLPDNQREFAFEHAGGEIIFSLPNGLQGYLLVKSDGTRIDDGPSKIVFDRDDSADVKGQITNGVSCIACHSGGINLKLDQIRDGALKIVPRGLRDKLEALFPANDAMDRMQKADKARFMAATAKLGIVDGCDQTQCEAVRKVSQRFAENVTFERAAAEFSKGLAVFRAAFGGKLKALRAQLEAGAVSRAEFINRFRQLVGDNPDFGEMSGCGTALGFAKPEAPASTNAPLETAPAATRLLTIDQQIETLSKTESSLLGPGLKNPSLSDPQLGLIRYKLADALYRKALLHIKTYKDKQAEIGIGHAIAKFLSVLDSPDSSDSGEGSSLHASALRRSIQSEAILVRGYQNLNKATAQKHASAAEQTYGLLKNSYRDATLPNGQLVVDAVRHDIDRQR
ncbi:hypothetical protein LBMAG49_31550 [Planctomycetota bacterium]|nr:hypothetical protein LBMAG49_31550 [Planctomycetota bacterium]